MHPALQDLEDLESLPGPSVCCIFLPSLWGPWVCLFLAGSGGSALWGPWGLSLGDSLASCSEDLESLQVLGPCYLSAFLRAQ